MARLPRFVLIGHPQHIIIRGNNRGPVFAAEEDCRLFLDNWEMLLKSINTTYTPM